MGYKHDPVLLDEVIEYLDPQPGDWFIDCTLGGGGYTRAITEKVGERGKVLSFDLDEMAIANANKYKNKNNLIIHDNFSNLSKIIEDNQSFFQGNGSTASSADQIQKELQDQDACGQFAGVVLDLGLSSAQLEDNRRGLSFKLAAAPLDMSFAGDARTTGIILNKYKEEELRDIIWNFGEEKFSKRIAKAIIESRKNHPIDTVGELVDIIRSSVPSNYANNKKQHFATRTFQALRIATNKELDNIRQVLPQAEDALKRGGRIVVISYHSLEDRIVKKFFKDESRDCLCEPGAPVCNCGHKAALKIITSKPVTPSEEEVRRNPRARSAKLRVAEKI